MGHSSACLKFIKQVRYKLLTGGELVEKEENKLSTRENMPIDSLNRFIGELGVLLKTLKSGH